MLSRPLSPARLGPFRFLCVVLVAVPGILACWRVLGPSRSIESAAQISPAGLLAVPDEKAGVLALIDSQTLEVIDQVPAGDRLREALLSPDGRRALVASDGSSLDSQSTLAMVDMTSHSVIDVIPLPGLFQPRSLSWTEGAALFLVDCTARPKKNAERLVAVANYDFKTHQVRRFFTFRAAKDEIGALAVSSDARTLYILNGATVAVRSLPDQGAVKVSSPVQIALPKPGRVLALSPSGSELWVGHSDFISVIDTTTRTIQRTISTGAHVVAMKFAPDGEQVFVAATRPARLLIVPTDGRGATRRVSLRHYTPTAIVAMPDARRVFIAANEGERGSRLIEIDVQDARFVGAAEARQTPPRTPVHELTPKRLHKPLLLRPAHQKQSAAN